MRSALLPPTPYCTEEFTEQETAILANYFTNVHGPVFAVVNLPEQVKGALFARYSRSGKSLRRLFLDEFADNVPTAPGSQLAPGLERASQLFERAFIGYGDDSVAQLGGLHVACEQASNVLTKVIERGRLMSYLEQSTRYIDYSAPRQDGTWRYYAPPELGPALAEKYRAALDAAFGDYKDLLSKMAVYYAKVFPRPADQEEGPWRRAVKAKALDTVRGTLPAATLSNVGVFGSAQAFEALVLRMRSIGLPEAQSYSDMLLAELVKVAPDLMRRVDMADRGVATVAYLADKGAAMSALAAELLGPGAPEASPSGVSLVDWDPTAEDKLVAAALYEVTHRSEAELRSLVSSLSQEDKARVLGAYTGERGDRRHKPGRAFEVPMYTFDVVCDYGVFRDLQRHRMATVDWQMLSPYLGYDVPQGLQEAGLESRFRAVMGRSEEAHDLLVAAGFTSQARYALSMAHKVRFKMTMNAREAMHVIELRTSPQGHDGYRVLAQQMHDQIATVAGHRAIAECMKFANHTRTAGAGAVQAPQQPGARGQGSTGQPGHGVLNRIAAENRNAPALAEDRHLPR